MAPRLLRLVVSPYCRLTLPIRHVMHVSESHDSETGLIRSQLHTALLMGGAGSPSTPPRGPAAGREGKRRALNAQSRDCGMGRIVISGDTAPELQRALFRMSKTNREYPLVGFWCALRCSNDVTDRLSVPLCVTCCMLLGCCENCGSECFHALSLYRSERYSSGVGFVAPSAGDC